MNTNSTGKQTFISPAMAAQELGVSVTTLKRLRQRGKIAHYRPSNRRILYTAAHINAFRAQNEHQAKVA